MKLRAIMRMINSSYLFAIKNKSNFTLQVLFEVRNICDRLIASLMKWVLFNMFSEVHELPARRQLQKWKMFDQRNFPNFSFLYFWWSIRTNIIIEANKYCFTC